MKQENTASITSTPNYEAIGRCVHLRAEINKVDILRFNAYRGLSRPDVYMDTGSDKMVYLPDIAAMQHALGDFLSANTKLKELVLEHNTWALLAGREPIHIIDFARKADNSGQLIGVDGKYDMQSHAAIS